MMTRDDGRILSWQAVPANPVRLTEAPVRAAAAPAVLRLLLLRDVTEGSRRHPAGTVLDFSEGELRWGLELIRDGFAFPRSLESHNP